MLPHLDQDRVLPDATEGLALTSNHYPDFQHHQLLCLVLNFIYKLFPRVCILASSLQQSAYETHLCCCMQQYFIFIAGWYEHVRMILSSVDRNLDCFHFCVITNSVALDILGLWLHIYAHLGEIPGLQLTILEGIHIAKEFFRVTVPTCSFKSTVLDISVLDCKR